MKFLFLKAFLSGTSVRPDHVAVFVFFLTVLNDSNCTINHEIPLKKLRSKLLGHDITSQEKGKQNELI